MNVENFNVEFTDSWGNKIRFYSSTTDNVLHLMITDNRHPTAGFLSYKDVTKMMEALEDYQVYVLENKLESNGDY